jgi:glycosyltransferase involved in cell wall biosynthesis
MRLLFVHQNFPAQYTHLVQHLAAQPNHEVVFITQCVDTQLRGVCKTVYKPARAPAPEVHPYLRDSEVAVLNAQEVARVATQLRKGGFVPDVMIGHNGWGEIWYLKEVFPDTPLIGYFEFFYRSLGGDSGFDPMIPLSEDTGARLRTKNLGNLLGLDTADIGVCPTEWQKSVYPQRYHSMLNVVHEGIDTSVARPEPAARVCLANTELEFNAGDEIVTYVARNLELARGFHVFMRSLPKILSARPRARVLIVGGDAVSYGPHLPPGQTFRKKLLAELGDSLDRSRVHFLGFIPHAAFLKVLQISRVHVYLTYPFVLSWSMLEAMSVGCLIVGSRTPPVEEVIQHGENGLLADFFAMDEIAGYVIEALAERGSFASLRRNARQTVIDRYDLHSVCLPAHLRLLNTLVPGSRRVTVQGVPGRHAAERAGGGYDAGIPG